MDKIKCLACDGKGKDDYHKKEFCIICDGTGSVNFSEPKVDKKKTKIKN